MILKASLPMGPMVFTLKIGRIGQGKKFTEILRITGQAATHFDFYRDDEF